MSSSFAYIDILLFAMLAVFIAYRLRSVLGRKTGNERPRPTAIAAREAKPEQEPAPMPVDAPDLPGLGDVRRIDPSFDPNGFLAGARTAFGMILDAYGKGDRETLQPLVEPDVYASFVNAIDGGEASGTTLLTIEDARIVGLRADGSIARVTVEFTSRQADKTSPEGDEEPIVDLWTFSRDTRSTDPNWRLSETRSPQA